MNLNKQIQQAIETKSTTESKIQAVLDFHAKGVPACILLDHIQQLVTDSGGKK